MSLGVVVIGVPSVVSCGVPGVFALGVPAGYISLYYPLFNLTLIIDLNQVSEIALTKFFFLNQNLDL